MASHKKLYVLEQVVCHEGLGILYGTGPDGIRLTGVLPCSPAERAGLMPHDIVRKIGGTPLKGLTAANVEALLQGPVGTDVRLELAAGKEAVRLVIVGRARFRVPQGGESHGLAFSPNGQLLAVALDDGSVRLWEPGRTLAPRHLCGHKGAVTCVGFSPDGKSLASASRDRQVRLWRVADGAEQGTFSGHSEAVTSLTFTADGSMLITGSGDRTVRLWRIAEMIGTQTK